jgi:hypothetical protein
VPTQGAGYRFSTNEYLSLPENKNGIVEVPLINSTAPGFKVAEDERSSVIKVGARQVDRNSCLHLQSRPSAKQR